MYSVFRCMYIISVLKLLSDVISLMILSEDGGGGWIADPGQMTPSKASGIWRSETQSAWERLHAYCFSLALLEHLHFLFTRPAFTYQGLYDRDSWVWNKYYSPLRCGTPVVIFNIYFKPAAVKWIMGISLVAVRGADGRKSNQVILVLLLDVQLWIGHLYGFVFTLGKVYES